MNWLLFYQILTRDMSSYDDDAENQAWARKAVIRILLGIVAVVAVILVVGMLT